MFTAVARRQNRL